MLVGSEFLEIRCQSLGRIDIPVADNSSILKFDLLEQHIFSRENSDIR